MERVSVDEMIQFFQEKKTYEDISNGLQQRYPGVCGFSVISIKRYCKINGISPRMSLTYLDKIVADVVEEV